jgi:membrane protein required for colicin V production
VLIISLIIVVAKITGFPEKDYAQNSKLYAQFNPVVEWMTSYVPQWLSKMKSLDPSSHDLVLENETGSKTPTDHLSVGI